MRLARPLAAAALVVGTLVTGPVTATPASALSPCRGYEPPDWCYSPPAAPSAPTNLVATAVLQTSVSLAWTNNAGSRDGYYLTRSASGVTTTVALPAGSTSYTDTSAPAGSAITYRVYARACNIYGCTDGAAATRSVTTRPKPASPVGTAYGWTQTYYGGPSNPDDIPWYGMKGWALDWDTTAPIQVVLVTDGVVTGSPVTAQGAASTNATYPGYGDNHGFTLSWLRKSTVKGTHQSCVKALDVAGGADTVVGCFSYYVPGPPAAASSVSAVSSGSYVTVSFRDNANDEAGYYLQRTADRGATWLQVGSEYGAVAGVGGTARVVDYSSVAAGTCYRILMVNRYGQTPSAAGCTA